MRLRRWFWTAAIALSLTVTPIMVGTSLFKAGYGFAELHESTDAGYYEWETNEAAIHHIVEVKQHWDIAGEIVLDWEERIVHLYGYYYDVFTGEFKIVISSEEIVIVVGVTHEEDAAHFMVKLLLQDLKARMNSQTPPQQPQPLIEASL